MAGLRTTTHVGINSENNVVNNAKNALLGKGAVLGSRSTRQAMGEISNVGLNRFAVRTGKDSGANLPPFQKPGRAMGQKTKTNSSLRAVVQGLSEHDVGGQKPVRKLRKRINGTSTENNMEVDSTHATNKQVNEDVAMEVEGVGPQNQGFSTKNLALFNVEDIDSEDGDDPQLVVNYVNEIYEYKRMLEREQSVKKGYLDGRIGVILPKMRSVLVEWMVEVHQQFSLLQETLYLSIAILDRYMQAAAERVARKSLQLVGVTAMFIAAKYEEMYAPEIGDFVYITDNAYTQMQIRETEIKIMSVLKFEMGRPLPLHFLRRNSKAGQVDAVVHMLAKYVMELTLLEYTFAHVLPSKIAATALAFSLKALDVDDKSLSELWNDTLRYYSQYELHDISKTLQQMATMVITTTQAPEQSKLLAIRKKYSHKKFGKIAEYPQLTNEAVQDMSNGIF